jgi:hypothetical protein
MRLISAPQCCDSELPPLVSCHIWPYITAHHDNPDRFLAQRFSYTLLLTLMCHLLSSPCSSSKFRCCLGDQQLRLHGLSKFTEW